MKNKQFLFLLLLLISCTRIKIEDLRVLSEPFILEYCRLNNLSESYAIDSIREEDDGFSIGYEIASDGGVVHSVVIYFSDRGSFVEMHSIVE